MKGTEAVMGRRRRIEANGTMLGNGGCRCKSTIALEQLSVDRYLPYERMKLLLVDDEQEICLLLNALLVRYGANTVMAHSLQEAGEKLAERGPFDGVFLDVNLPDGKGYELIEEINSRSPDARVIVISAMDQERVHAIEAGADLFLAKPLDRSSILEGLRKVHLLDPEKETN